MGATVDVLEAVGLGLPAAFGFDLGFAAMFLLKKSRKGKNLAVIQTFFCGKRAKINLQRTLDNRVLQL